MAHTAPRALRFLGLGFALLAGACANHYQPEFPVNVDRGPLSAKLEDVAVQPTAVQLSLSLTAQDGVEVRSIAIHNGDGAGCDSTAFAGNVSVNDDRSERTGDLSKTPLKLARRTKLVAGFPLKWFVDGEDLVLDIGVARGERRTCLRVPILGSLVRFENRTQWVVSVPINMRFTSAGSMSNTLGFGVGAGRTFGSARVQAMALPLTFVSCQKRVCGSDKEGAFNTGYGLHLGAEAAVFPWEWLVTNESAQALGVALRYEHIEGNFPRRSGAKWERFDAIYLAPSLVLYDSLLRNIKRGAQHHGAVAYDLSLGAIRATDTGQISFSGGVSCSLLLSL